jgi:chemotaxis signal transduction protein
VTTETHITKDDSWTATLLKVNSLTVGIPAEHVLTVSEWIDPTPLPFGPPTVFGIVSIQGRMFTVINLGLILGPDVALDQPRQFVALHGDEQLAIAATSANEVVDIKTAQITRETESTLLHGKIQVDGREVLLLDVDSLFAGVIRGRERRKRRL